MTRWKHSETTTLVHLYAHNLWAKWYDCKLQAAEQMGLNVGKTEYQIHDNSWSTEYYVSTPALIKKGGMDKLEELAYKVFYLQYEE